MAQLYKQIADIADALMHNQLSLALAESCTAGGIAYYLSQVPGASQWLDRAYVTYTPQAKNQMLNVPVELIDKFGVVSEEVAISMAEGVLNGCDAHVSLSITGYAGPSGGTETTPVGTVFIGLCDRHATRQIIHKHFTGNREQIRFYAISSALDTLHHYLKSTQS